MIGVKQWLGAGASALAIFAVSAGTASAQEDSLLVDTKVSTERGVRAQGADAPGRVKNYLRSQGLTDDAIGTLVEKRQWKGRNGRTHFEFAQQVNGRRVVGSVVKASADADGNLLTVSRRLANGRQIEGGNSLSAGEAIGIAAGLHHDGAPQLSGNGRKVGLTTSFDKGSFFHVDPTAEEVFVARKNGRMEPGYLVTTWSEADNLLVETVINGRGKVVSSEVRTAEDSYNVYEIHPDVSNQAVVQGPASTTASPNGWLGTGTQYATLISGNNVRAYLDTNNSNTPDSPSRVVSDGNFTTVAQLNQSPSTTINKEVAVQNLFYLNNVIHDALYGYGFTEATRNFQEDNFGRGGAGSDSVEAQAQDGGGVNNANFATPSDGSNPRMQMYLWNTTANGLDGDLDGDIVWHEYGHGLTWRMIGSMSGAFPGAIGEGMSDALAIIMTDDDRVGEYATTDTNRGIRRYRYEGYPLTFANFSGSSVHSDGEIYAATLWDLKKRYAGAGHNRDVLMGDIVDGMNFTAPGPDFLDMRNGILDSAPADRDCLVWESFAAFGMGNGASIQTKGRRQTINESFAVPSSCDGTPPPPPPPPPGDVELTALSGSSATSGKRRWRATANLTTSASGVTVAYSWNDGNSGTCTTDGSGSCSVQSASYRTNQRTSLTFTVDQIAGAAPAPASGVNLTVTMTAP
ncbi:hypothetical protein HK107_14910 [Parvularcula sp. ZS-1/3]|uniref:FTP domain-containing protein n=1 Tax=Parvularcula mediterranea TaxID=2732508 RepID=A0A7Y3RP71_9PROT|nr:M36 family metallopeptidase [Parvularcula mediterranea]NNU17620.1 hypothetical protein [Parvularcula mediterranea]